MWSLDDLPNLSTFNASSENDDLSTFLKVLDDQHCRVNSKYKQILLKTQNVPIVIVASELPDFVKEKGSSLQARLIPLEFQHHTKHLEEDPLLATPHSSAFVNISFIPLFFFIGIL